MSDASALRAYLVEAAAGARAGEQLPTVRQLMRDFGLSQPAVQKVLGDLKSEGLIAAHVGRGTFFTGKGAGETAALRATVPLRHGGRSVMLLRRSPSTERGRLVAEDLQKRLSADGAVTLEVAYSDAEHARQALHGLPRFDACIVQNSFEEMPIEMLAAIRRKTDTVVVDGAWLVGTDIDAVGFEWGGPVERAVDGLVEKGHSAIALVTTASSFLANELGRHRYEQLRARPTLGEVLHPPILLDRLPRQDYEEAVVAALTGVVRSTDRKLDGVIVWGIENGALFRRLLAEAGLSVPDALSVILLGRTDIEVERAGFFELIGYSSTEQAEAVYARLSERWIHPRAPHSLKLIPAHACPGESVLTRVADGAAGPARSTARRR